MSIQKISILINAALGLSALASLGCFLYFVSTASHIQKVSQEQAICLSLGNDLRESSRQLTANVRMYAVTGEQKYADAYQAVLDERAGVIPRFANREYFANEKHALMDILRRYGLSAEEEKFVNEASTLSNALVPLEQEAMHAVRGEFRDESGKYAAHGKPDRDRAIAAVFGEEYVAQTRLIMAQLLAFDRALHKRLNAAVAEAEQSQRMACIVFIGSIVVLCGIIVWYMLYMHCSVVKPLIVTRDFALKLADNDFGERIPVRSGNEIGQLRTALNTMADHIDVQIKATRTEAEKAKRFAEDAQEAVKDSMLASAEAERKTETMLNVANKLDEAGDIISQATTQLSQNLDRSDQGARETAMRLSEAASAINELNATVGEVARSADVAAVAARETREKAQQGARIVAESLQSIGTVREIAGQLGDDMAQLNQHAQNITQILGVIMDIADQTNLLALNAAIEAARAGETGRGFAVVADEVRKLAEKTTASTADVRKVITAIQDSTRKSMNIVEGSTKQIMQASGLAEQSGQALKAIVETVDTVADQIAAIATASKQQSGSSEEIKNSIHKVSGMASDTADAMHEAAGVVADLAVQAQELNGMIDDLKQ